MQRVGCYSAHVRSCLSSVLTSDNGTQQLAVISQGIAARYARRQASSEKAAQQGAMFPSLGLMARQVILEGNGADKGPPSAAKAKL